MRLLVLPLETKVRELDSKLLLACYAVRRGFRVMLGWHGEVKPYIRFCEPAILLEKSVNADRAGYFGELKERGHLIAALDEEGLVFRSFDDYLRCNVPPRSLDLVDRFFTWGDAQARAVRAGHPQAADRVVVSGNPRIDLLRPPYRSSIQRTADEIRRKYGDFILLNTNFASNNYWGPDGFINGLKNLGVIQSDEEEQFHRAALTHSQKIQDAFVELIKHLHDALPYGIVIRPHPSEDHDFWRRETAALSRVRVAHEGSVGPWLAAARTVVHNGCTTAIEADALGTRVVSFVPCRSDEFDLPLPNQVGREVATVEEAAQAISELGDRDGMADPPSADPVLDEFIANRTGRFAAERLVDELVELAGRPGTGGPGRFSTIRCISTAVMNRARRRGSQVWRDLRGAPRSPSEQKFPGLGRKELECGLERVAALSNDLPPFRVRRVPGTRTSYYIEASP